MICSTLCPAKINLFLAVDPPDHSGYHPIRSLFQSISLADQISIGDSPTGKDLIECNWPGLPANNTMSKALRLVRELVPVAPLHITLEKRIPNEAGLGGGSSDAAGLLRCLMRVMPHMVTEHFAREVAFAVGADVPYFLVGGYAKVEGYGEIVTPLEDLGEKSLLVVKPSIGMPTGEAYQKLDAAPRPQKEFPDNWQDLYNDFERVAPCECGDIAERLLANGATSASLTGSGTAVFGIFANGDAAQRAKLLLEQERLGKIFPARFLTRKESLCTTLSS